MLLGKKEFIGRASFMFNKSYIRYIPYFVRILRLTRLPFLKFNSFFMAAMQLNMIRTLSSLEEAVREGKRRLKDGKEENINGLEKGLKINVDLIRVLKTIADGIAWRSLRFNRPIIRLLSDGKSAGHINPVYPGLKKALGIKDLFIFNDLTRCLRTADVTRIFKNGKIILYEMKKKGKVVKSARDILEEMKKHSRSFSKQELKQLIAQDAIIGKKILIPIFEEGKLKSKLEIEIMDLSFPIKNHIQKIKKLINKADKKGFAFSLLENGYYVEINAHDRLIKGTKKFPGRFQVLKNEHNLTKPNWYDNKRVAKIHLSNYDGFFQEHTEYPRNLTPPSLLPFKIKDCVRIMMGYLLISITFNIDLLKEKLLEKGWEVSEGSAFSIFADREEFMKKPGDLSKYVKNEDVFILSKKEQGGFYQVSLPFTLLVIMVSSFYGTDFILDTLENLYKQPRKEKRGQKFLAMNFVKEKNVLI